MIYKPRRETQSRSTRIITKYNRQHGKVWNVFWYFLTADQKINKFIKSYPEITFKRSKSIKHTMVASHHIGNKVSKIDKPGTYPCGKCNYCSFILRGENVNLPNNTSWTPRHRITCQSVSAVYIMKCCCGAFYIGKTKHPYFCRIRNHVSPISKRKMESLISRHMGLYHNHNLKMIGFFALEYIPPHERGGDIDKKLLQIEAKWIYLLQATRYPGLNEGISYKPFLQSLRC